MKLKYIIFSFAYMIFLFSCRQKGIQHNIKIKNETDSLIIINSCDMTTFIDFPIQIDVSQNTEIVIEGSNEAAIFTLTVNDKKFMLNTGYIQDSEFVNIEIVEESAKLTAIKKNGNSKQELIFQESN